METSSNCKVVFAQRLWYLGRRAFYRVFLTSDYKMCHSYEDVIVAGEKNCLYSALMSFQQRSTLSCHTCFDMGLGFCGYFQMTSIFSHLQRQPGSSFIQQKTHGFNNTHAKMTFYNAFLCLSDVKRRL